eukprot:m.188222 g.188222  ORF g.188222 m.188222 type:complete len:246 (+) comp15081_c1_seq1:5995-6732(+)
MAIDLHFALSEGPLSARCAYHRAGGVYSKAQSRTRHVFRDSDSHRSRQSVAEFRECAAALIHAVFFHRDHLAVMQHEQSTQSRPAPLEQECQSVDIAYVVRDRVVKDIVQAAVNDFVTKVRDSRSAKIVLRFYKKDEKAGLFGSSKTYWEEWTFDFDIVDTLHDPSKLRKRKKGLAQVLGTQMAKISSNCVDNMATVPSPDPKSLGSYVDRKSDVYWHEFSSESTAAKGGSSRTKGFFTGIFAPA